MDREKVIKGLECCNYYGFHEDCPYDKKDPNEEQDTTCMMDLMRDALALLKEQEAVSPYQFEDIWKCGNCGDGVVAYEELSVSGIEEVKFNYCPTCGRRVLWEGR